MTDTLPWCESCGQYVAPDGDELCPSCGERITWVPEEL